ncbi:cupin domain-containing protein [Agromyces ramosus]|nr:cupin domain-containing protein [Agromyces ramosus]
MTHASTFPGGTAVSWLDVYDTESIDGLRGGTPHLHLVSPECYVVVAGRGRLQTLIAAGVAETPLAPGTVAWFTPGTVHRAVNDGELRVLVLMANSGLPEAGDAVMTFPPEHLVDAATYRAAAQLPDRETEAERQADADRRRDLAVQGFLDLRSAMERGAAAPLERLYAAAARIVQPLVPGWEPIWNEVVGEQAERTRATLPALANGDWSSLLASAVFEADANPGERRFGMCGRLSTYRLGA